MIRWLWLLVVIATGTAGCTGARRDDPTYNTKQILINDRRE